jgi:hypothetical protein
MRQIQLPERMVRNLASEYEKVKAKLMFLQNHRVYRNETSPAIFLKPRT